MAGERGLDVGSLAGGVAVITGAASGLGLACARQCARCGLHVALLDVRPDPLAKVVVDLEREFASSSPGLRFLAVPCDVTERSSVEQALAAVQQHFRETIVYLGANAGVLFPRSTVLRGTAHEWMLTMGVNVLGVVHTLQVFLPAMLAESKPCVVVNTASVAGLLPGISGPYGCSKHACVALTEALHDELQMTPGGNKVHLHVLCPALVNTSLMHTSNEVGMTDGAAAIKGDAYSETSVVGVFAKEQWAAAMDADYVAGRLFAGIRNGDFYVTVGGNREEPAIKGGIKVRVAGMLASPSTHANFIKQAKL